MATCECKEKKVITCEQCLRRLDGDIHYWCGLSHKTKTVKPTDTCDQAIDRMEWMKAHGF